MNFPSRMNLQIYFFILIQALYTQTEQIGTVWEVSNESFKDLTDLESFVPTHHQREIIDDTGESVIWEHDIGKRSVEAVEDISKENTKSKEKYETKKEDALPFYSNREARGATKEQWIKQPYPVDFQSRKEDDQSVASTDQVRAPRVHFVTNTKRFDTAESREPEPQRSTSPPRTTRMFDSRVNYNSRAPDPYDYRDTRRRKSYMDRDYNQYDLDPPRYNPVATSRYNEYDLDPYKPAPKKRIIYYTTLPEVVRSPPSYRNPEPPILSPPYNDYYMKRYHDGRVTSSPVAVSDNYYRDDYDRDGYRYPSPPPQRYLPNYRPFQGGGSDRPIPDDRRRPPASSNKERMVDRNPSDTTTTDPYPAMKISTGVNVKDSDRKVPERRVYADRDREYVYALPSFQLADDDNYNSSPYYERRY